MAAAPVRSGRELSVQYPVADALEAAAAVAERVGAPAEDVAALLAAAAEVGPAASGRLRSRCGPPSTRCARAWVSRASPAPDIAGACDLAERLLAADRVG